MLVSSKTRYTFSLPDKEEINKINDKDSDVNIVANRVSN